MVALSLCALAITTAAARGPIAGVVFAQDAAAAVEMAQRGMDTPLPSRSPIDLAVRLSGMAPPASTVAPDAAGAGSAVGATDTFWILDQRRASLFQASATARVVTSHAYWFVADDLADHVDQADLERGARVFEDATYPVVTHYFGAPRIPSSTGDTHIVMLLAAVPGVAAYFSSADAYPRSVNPRSNERPMMYINASSVRPGTPGFDATLAHELQHMASFSRCPVQEGWVDEGASELAMRVAGFDGTSPLSFSAHPDTQLTTWTASPNELTRHYGAAYLFLRYVIDRAGGPEALTDLFGTCARGEDLFAAFLARHPLAPDVESLFADWAVANLVDNASVADGRFAYASTRIQMTVAGSVTPETSFSGSVPQYATDYLEVPAGPGTLNFSGAQTVSVLGVPLDESGVWWSNRGDTIDARLTRQVDLRAVSSATLRFKAWYDLEDRYDFVYVSVSRDAGQTWDVLPGLHTQADSDTGNNFGQGWTGSSSDMWLDEEVDLSRFAGSQVMLRFDYVTDQSYTGQGFAFKDISIREVGLFETGAGRGWDAEGWVRVDAPLPQRWNVRLVRWASDGVDVDAVPVDDDGQAHVVLDPVAYRQVLVVAPTAPRTLMPGTYDVSIS
ncbi:MAG: immune inhibitor A [Chloroflexota bacterium]